KKLTKLGKDLQTCRREHPVFEPPAPQPLRYSTGCVAKYETHCNIHDIDLTIPEGAAFRFWYDRPGFQLFSAWENEDVWHTDFRDAGLGDLEYQGGSDIPDVYLFSGHGSCPQPRVTSWLDHIITCDKSGDNRTTFST